MAQNLTATIRDKRGRILAIGRNSYTKTHPQQAKYASACGVPFARKIYLHAEIDAICKAARTPRRPWSIHIERKLKNGQYGLAKPCPICQFAIIKAGIKMISYT